MHACHWPNMLSQINGFTDTKAGFKFFQEYFDYPYPYGNKYDQIIVPDFNAGAMENVAAVTFSERFVRDGAQVRILSPVS
ncbi:MAG: M1 family aminopeptidase [Bdellovibrionales bacterium]